MRKRRDPLHIAITQNNGQGYGWKDKTPGIDEIGGGNKQCYIKSNEPTYWLSDKIPEGNPIAGPGSWRQILVGPPVKSHGRISRRDHADQYQGQ